MKKEKLENYIHKGELEGFPKEIIAHMLDCQEEQNRPRDVTVFERNIIEGGSGKGFTWDKTQEGWNFWYKVIREKDFNLFFERYPKKDNQQDFRINDKVYDILRKEVGVVQDIVYSSNIAYGLSVEFKSGLKSYTINGCYIHECKNPQLLHYRDDYNYDVIDFNNLPERQELKKWRAKKGKVYNFVSFDNECWFFSDGTKDDYAPFDNDNYNSGNYFQSENEAQEVANKLNEYFKQLIQN